MLENSSEQKIYTMPVKAPVTYRDTSNRPFPEPNKNKDQVVVGIGTNPIVIESTGFLFKKYSLANENPNLKRIGQDHGRNITESLENLGVPYILWTGDEPGDKYGQRTRKGVLMVIDPHIEEDENSPTHSVHTIGLMDRGVVDRIRRASLVMRSLGLPTENPRTIRTLKEVWITNKDGVKENVSVKKWKEMEIARLERVAQESEKTGSREQYLHNLKILSNARQYLKDAEFVIMERDLQVDVRLEDIAHAASRNELKKVMGPIFKWLNVVFKYTRKGLISKTEAPDPFELNSNDIIRYFKDWLPSQMGIYLGRYHANKLFHGFSHFGNWQGVATLMDLDSASGKKIYSSDNNPTNKDYAQDLFDSSDALDSLFIYNFPKCDEFKGKNVYKIASEASYVLFKNYFTERFGDQLTVDSIGELEKVYGNRAGSFEGVVKPIFDKLKREINQYPK